MNNDKSEVPEVLQQLADGCGGKITEVSGPLPDGSGFAVMSIPLPKDHWIYGDPTCLNSHGHEYPPMPFRLGNEEALRMWPYRLPVPRVEILNRLQMAEKIRAAGKYAIRKATMNGKEMDFDPDALLQNLIVGFLGYNTANGMGTEDWENPPYYGTATTEHD